MPSTDRGLAACNAGYGGFRCSAVEKDMRTNFGGGGRWVGTKYKRKETKI